MVVLITRSPLQNALIFIPRKELGVFGWPAIHTEKERGKPLKSAIYSIDLGCEN
jgi:hypothetical protein